MGGEKKVKSKHVQLIIFYSTENESEQTLLEIYVERGSPSVGAFSERLIISRSKGGKGKQNK